MLSWKNLTAIAAVVTGSALAQPTLTTIQDTLYRADGTRFTGTVYINYDSFQGADASNVATANLTVPVVNGSLRVRLVPTTSASAGAQYKITYNASGINQFTETWAVPSTSSTLRVRDVRLGSGTLVGPPPVTTPVQISDVIGLSNELDVRPMRGSSFGLGRAAVINSSGLIDGASGSLSDCVHVDGSAGPCGGGGGGSVSGSFADAETPAGLINSSNTTFVLAHAPAPVGSLTLFRNGLRLAAGVDYTLSGSTVTFFVVSTPQTGDQLLANYRYGDPNNSAVAAQVICSGVGNSTSAGTVTQLGSCTVPTGILGTGDRLEIRFQMAHTGSAVGFSGEVRVGGTTIVTRSAPSTETRFSGQTDFSVYGTGQQVWDSQTWGTTLAQAFTSGNAAENTAGTVTIAFRGQLATSAADVVSLRNFTVIRYPAQSNP
jgi:hypothetical protein